jgi:hypothetical protein
MERTPEHVSTLDDICKYTSLLLTSWKWLLSIVYACYGHQVMFRRFSQRPNPNPQVLMAFEIQIPRHVHSHECVPAYPSEECTMY